MNKDSIDTIKGWFENGVLISNEITKPYAIVFYCRTDTNEKIAVMAIDQIDLHRLSKRIPFSVSPSEEWSKNSLVLGIAYSLDEALKFAI